MKDAIGSHYRGRMPAARDAGFQDEQRAVLVERKLERGLRGWEREYDAWVSWKPGLEPDFDAAGISVASIEGPIRAVTQKSRVAG
jgi:hypothetical protein